MVTTTRTPYALRVKTRTFCNFAGSVTDVPFNKKDTLDARWLVSGRCLKKR